MKIHILTTNINGMEEPKARWTHLIPDQRLQEFSTFKNEIMDMFLMHFNDVHYDLIIKKDSILATEGDIPNRRSRQEKEVDIEEENQSNEGPGPGYMGWSMNEHENETENQYKCETCEKMFHTAEELSKHKEQVHIIEYKVKCEKCKKTFTDFREKNKHMDSGCNESQEYLELKQQFEDLKVEYEKLKIAYDDLVNKIKNKDGNESNLKRLKTEVNKLKNDYKHIMEAIQKETLGRNKAETELKVIKDTISAKEELKRLKTNEEVKENAEEIMMVDEEEWVEPKRRSKKRKNSFISPAKNLNCRNYEEKISTPDKFEDHERSHIEITKIKCSLCEGTFETKEELTGHMTSHKAEQDRSIHSCDKCGKMFETKEQIEEHEKSHVETNGDNTKLECNKCEKFYYTMSKLRRHDWRAHREINCSICDEKITSREQISIHRQSKHNMTRKIACKFYPDCIDGDECLYSHGDLEKTFCRAGNNCVNQSCEFSEANHLKSKIILCKFQENCHRFNCTYKHMSERKAFLGVNLQNKNVK